MRQGRNAICLTVQVLFLFFFLIANTDDKKQPEEQDFFLNKIIFSHSRILNPESKSRSTTDLLQGLKPFSNLAIHKVSIQFPGLVLWVSLSWQEFVFIYIKPFTYF